MSWERREVRKWQMSWERQALETVTSFMYLGSVISDEGSKLEILSRIAQTTAAVTRLKPVWNDSSISLSSKIRLMRSLVTSIFLYGGESWARREVSKWQMSWERQALETVTSFMYLGSVITDEGSKLEILSRIAQTTAALTRLKPVWIDKIISLTSKIRLMRSLVTYIFLYAQQSPQKAYKPWKLGVTARH